MTLPGQGILNTQQSGGAPLLEGGGGGQSASPPAASGPVDWAALYAMQQAGLTQQDVEALAQMAANGGAPGAAAPASPFGTVNPQTVTPAAIAQVQQLYPSLAWMLQIPQLSNVIINAASTGMDSAQLQAEIQSTTWWTTQSSGARSFFAEEMSGDLVDAQNSFNAQQDAIGQTFAQLGLNPTSQQIQTFAWESLVNGWTPSQSLAAISKGIQVNADGSFQLNPYYVNQQGQQIDVLTGQPYTGGETLQTTTNAQGQTIILGVQAGGGYPNSNGPEQGGALQSLEQNFQSLAKQYIVNFSPAQIGQWVKNAVGSGQTTQQAEQGFQAMLQDTALSQYPWMAQGIQAGQTPLSLVSPYSNMLASELGISSQNIDWTQPQYQKLLSTPDPKTGTPMQNPIWQATQQVRSDPQYGWSNTAGGKSAIYSFIQGMQETMGQKSYSGVTPGTIATPESFGSSGG